MSVEFEIGYHGEITELANGTLLDSQQLGIVVAANIAQDLFQTKSFIHFDNCDFPGGIGHIDDEWNAIDTQGNRSDAALVSFGALLHTVQDFYAHSNWIELHLDSDPVPTWDLKLSSLPANIVSGTWSLGSPKLCGPGAPSHSQLNKDSPKSPEGSKVVSSGPNTGKSYFDLAFSAALAASKLQFSRLAQLPPAAIAATAVETPPDLEDLVEIMRGLRETN
ncbi:hypothetical protein [Roseibium sp. Sym1]|uniref:hypothetical protein n=1 Tax=Roseibium sp. Sym1 TaxID=3016006 RepID=UPI0022B425E2|nr:hypothetical protein [Roseibium sp. Sym1]